ncbi:hypothetical protein [Mycobacterium haemophilum]|uniref:Alanine and proline rich protein n=1 Tax=Mycobacterium haemophilum TaxID=29311 RepID=A0A0I9XPU9_9MYCO|nr:hypothetical protein [Mycobacterium haemophilum]KLO28902.1 hypothetical protein ABH39_13125 [Mycobacterium haemophilum]KLO35665.1 hypothetical protein ABH38_15200 [Mycobacterium haemophilum]KLO41090.1 hypothetical protein ABH37_14265 [Mycobacterium haemophilum]KLO49072.1 hypothetical protein ABH36_14070 [Mycobacterium haemophilum]
MAERLDVTERLAEGSSAVEHTQRYVRACQMLGYQQPDLTSRPFQIRDWYDSEDGLDLRALDRDCAELRAAGIAVTDVLRMQHALVAELAAAWTGPGSDSAVRFLQAHCDAGNTVATEVRVAAQRCESLRDNLWYLLDSKVATAIAIDDRTLALRPAWLAAADAVTIGVADRSMADELVHQQIKPYVDNDIRNDWLTVMRSTLAGVAASYDMVTDRLAAAPPAYFEIPGDLGPGWEPVPPAPASAPTTAAVLPPAAFPALPPDAAPALTPAPTGADSPASSGTFGGPSNLGGLGGLASRIVEAMGDLLGSAAEQLSDPSALDDRLGESPFATDDDATDDDATDDDAGDNPDARAEEGEQTAEADKVDEPLPVEESPPGGVPPQVNEPLEAPSVDAPPPVATPPPVAAPPSNGSAPPPSGRSTPCEIAADELPQAGQ